MNEIKLANQLLGNLRFKVMAALALALGIGADTDAGAMASSQTAEWTTASPEEVGLDSTILSQMFDYVREHNVPVHSVQILRHGKLVLDAYFYPYSSEMRHDVASVTKSITSTLIGLAIEKGFIRDVQQPVLGFFWDRTVANRDTNKQKLTLEHLLTMQAGWDCGFEAKEARLFEMRSSPDWLQFMVDLPMLVEPGTRFAYCSGNPHILSIILSRATGTSKSGLTIGSLVGFVTLFGITMRNSIMMISHFEHLVNEESQIWNIDTALRGASERFVPIIMTALVTALGLLPLALGTGEAGREIEGPMAVVILGGLITSTLLNLLVLPVLALRYGRFKRYERQTE